MIPFSVSFFGLLAVAIVVAWRQARQTQHAGHAGEWESLAEHHRRMTALQKATSLELHRRWVHEGDDATRDAYMESLAEERRLITEPVGYIADRRWGDR